MDLKERFEKNFEKAEDCWLWNGPITTEGYGKFFNGIKQLSAHRVAYELYKNTIENKDIYVTHSCQNRHCVNPDHLALINKEDAVRRTRTKKPKEKIVDNKKELAYLLENEIIINKLKVIAKQRAEERLKNGINGLLKDKLEELTKTYIKELAEETVEDVVEYTEPIDEYTIDSSVESTSEISCKTIKSGRPVIISDPAEKFKIYDMYTKHIYSKEDLAEKYSVSKATIYRIIKEERLRINSENEKQENESSLGVNS